MSSTITVRLPDDLAEWLSETSPRTGVPQGRIIREELEKARTSEGRKFPSARGCGGRTSRPFDTQGLLPEMKAIADTGLLVAGLRSAE
ncbi:MAG: ribbon-helix-helix domain-containing protein [Acidobacteriia bacterium]|nr:ribbon-helix-helix domain-containing protein [Terriglobia bacterium]